MVPMLVFRSGLPSLFTGFLWSWWPSVDGLCLWPALSVTFRVLFSVFLSLGFATLFQLPVGSAPEICFPVSWLSWCLLVLPPGLLDISGDWLSSVGVALPGVVSGSCFPELCALVLWLHLLTSGHPECCRPGVCWLVFSQISSGFLATSPGCMSSGC